jgi:hypothetical protein
VDSSPRRWPSLDLRVGDDDRQRVVGELQRHYVAGRLSSDELSERVASALGARTFGDLASVLSDLPNEQPLAQSAAGVPARRDWAASAPVIAALLVAVAFVALLALQFSGWHTPTPFWSILFLFFVFGWPRGGRRRHF